MHVHHDQQSIINQYNLGAHAPVHYYMVSTVSQRHHQQ